MKVEDGSGLVNDSGETLGKIVKANKSIFDVVAETAAASDGQRAGIDGVNRAIMHLGEMTQSHSALIEEAATAGASMSTESRNLSGCDFLSCWNSPSITGRKMFVDKVSDLRFGIRFFR